MNMDFVVKKIGKGEFLENKIVKKTLTVGLFLLLLFLAGIKLYSAASFNSPHEFRETNIVAFAKMFAEGKNPYSLSTLNEEIPVVTSQYGFLVPLLLAPFVKIGRIFGFSHLQVCQIITIIVELLGALLAYLIILKNSKNSLLSIAGTIVIYSCYWRYAAFGGTFPDQYGVTLSLLLLYFVNSLKESKRHNYICIIIICIMLFYVKQYFVFNIVGLSVYLFFYSRRDFLKFIIYGTIFGVISAVLVTKIFPLYFPEAIVLTSGTVGNAGWEYSLKQIKTIGWKFYPLISVAYVALICAYTLSLVRKFKSKSEYEKQKLPSYATVQSICILPIVIVLSLNIGTYWTYYLQLWWIYVILTVFEKMPELHAKSIVSAFFLAITLMRIAPLVVEKPLNLEQKHNWEITYKFLDHYSRQGDILVSPHLSAYCLEHQISTSDYGQAEFNSSGNLNRYLKNKIWSIVFPKTELILTKNITYNDKILENIKNQKYSAVVLTDMGRYWLKEEDLEKSGYKKTNEFILVTGTQHWKTIFYVVSKGTPTFQ